VRDLDESLDSMNLELDSDDLPISDGLEPAAAPPPPAKPPAARPAPPRPALAKPPAPTPVGDKTQPRPPPGTSAPAPPPAAASAPNGGPDPAPARAQAPARRGPDPRGRVPGQARAPPRRDVEARPPLLRLDAPGPRVGGSVRKPWEAPCRAAAPRCSSESRPSPARLLRPRRARR